MRLETVVLFLGEYRLQAVVEYDNRQHAVLYKWYEKDPTDVPPKKWYQSVKGEVDWRLGEEYKAKHGRKLPDW